MGRRTSFFIVIIVAVQVDVISNLQCIASERLTIAADHFDHGRLGSILARLPTVDQLENDRCRLRLMFNNGGKDFTIAFGNEVAGPLPLSNGEIFFQSLIFPQSISLGVFDQFMTIKSLQYSCSEHDLCDGLFALDIFDAFMVEHGGQFLFENIQQILSGGTIKPGQCHVQSNKKMKCQQSQCVGISWSNRTTHEYRCPIGSELASKVYIDRYFVPVRIGVTAGTRKFQQVQMIKHVCAYDLCNSELVTNQLRKVVEEKYDTPYIKSRINPSREQTTQSHSTSTIESATELILMEISPTVSQLGMNTTVNFSIEFSTSSLPPMDSLTTHENTVTGKRVTLTSTISIESGCQKILTHNLILSFSPIYMCTIIVFSGAGIIDVLF